MIVIILVTKDVVTLRSRKRAAPGSRIEFVLDCLQRNRLVFDIIWWLDFDVRVTSMATYLTVNLPMECKITQIPNAV